MIVAQARTRWDGSVEIEFPFNRSLVEALKAEIPSCHREWNPERKVWVVASPWARTAVGLLRTYFPDAERVAEPRPTPIRPFDDAYQTLYLQPNAPPYLVDVVYKALAQQEHPDHKPLAEREQAHERMVAINRAVEILRAKVAS